MPTARKRSRSHQTPNADLLPQLLNSIRLPRCCVCDLDWFDDDEVDELTVENKTSDEYLRRKCKKLLPMPQCKCSTTLLVGGYDGEHNGEPTISTSDLRTILSQAKRMDEEQIATLIVNKFCHGDNFKEYQNKAMCYECIEPFVSTSKDVIEHDYKSDTQPNVKFSVGGKCTCCRKKFSARSLDALVGTCKKNNTLGTEREEWIENVKTTVQFVWFRKKLKGMLGNLKKSNEHKHTYSHHENINRWLTDPEEYLSDDYFSDYGGKDLEDSNISNTSKKKNVPSHLAPEKGEIMQDLIKKDPKFRQELEDLEYIQTMSKTSEGRRTLGIEEAVKVCQSEQEIECDARLAKEITRREELGVRKRKAKSPILSYFGKTASALTSKGSSMMNFKKPKKRQTNKGIKKYMIGNDKSSDESDQSNSDGSTSIQLLITSELETVSRTKQEIDHKVTSAPIEIVDSCTEDDNSLSDDDRKPAAVSSVMLESARPSHSQNEISKEGLSASDDMNVPHGLNESAASESNTECERKTPELAYSKDVEEIQFQSELLIQREQGRDEINAGKSEVFNEINLNAIEGTVTTIEILDSDSDSDNVNSVSSPFSATRSPSIREKRKLDEEDGTNDALSTRRSPRLQDRIAPKTYDVSVETKLKEIISMGFNRHESHMAMVKADFDTTIAVDILLNK